jgi:chemotaxis methyl-accepting protein methylase
MSTVIEGLTATALRKHLAHAEQQAFLADYIDNTERMLREQKYWQAIARQIRAEMERRGKAQ